MTKNSKYEGRILDPKLVSLKFNITKNVVENHATQIKILLRVDQEKDRGKGLCDRRFMGPWEPIINPNFVKDRIIDGQINRCKIPNSRPQGKLAMS